MMKPMEAPTPPEALAPPSFLRGVLETEGWTRLQHVWDGAPHLAEEFSHTQAPFDWDTLRLATPRAMTRLPFASDLLPPGAKALLISMMHRRLDIALETVAQARKQRGAYDVGAPAPSRLGELKPLAILKATEALIIRLQQGGKLPPITKAIFQRVNGDANLELLSRLHGEISPGARESLWPVLLEWALALSYHSDDTDLCRLDLDLLMGDGDSVRLVHDTIRGEPPLKVAEAAVRLAERRPDTAIVPPLAALLAGRYPHHLKRSIAGALAAVGDTTAIAHLIRLLLSDTPDDRDDGMPYYRVRMAAMAAVTQIAVRGTTATDTVVPALRQALYRESLSAASRLQAIIMLARHFGIKEGFDLASKQVVEAAAREYAEVRDLAAEALAALGNHSALNALAEALQHVNRAETSLERLRPVGADNPQALLNALEAFGLPMHWSDLTQRWTKGHPLLPAPGESPGFTANP
jgi:hypothetical protein